MSSKVTHHTLNAWLYYLVMYHLYIHISVCRQFSDIHISQGSAVTYLRCGRKFIRDFVANLPLSLSVKEFQKSVNIWRSYGQEFSVLFFLTHGVHVVV